MSYRLYHRARRESRCSVFQFSALQFVRTQEFQIGRQPIPSTGWFETLAVCIAVLSASR